MRRQAVLGLVGAVALAVTTFGCGDDGGSTTETGSASGSGSASAPAGAAPVSLPGTVADHGTAALEGSALDLELDDQYFAPTFVEASPGATVTVTLTNEGDLPHTFTIDDTAVDEEVAAGESATVEVTLPDRGSLRYYCRFHVAGGMQGAFVVSAEDGATATTVVSGGASGY
jgi:plastocyanin